MTHMTKTSFSFQITNTTTGEIVAGNVNKPNHFTNPLNLRRRILQALELFSRSSVFYSEDDFHVDIFVSRTKEEINIPFDTDVY